MFICISSLKLLDKLDVLQVKAGLFKSAFFCLITISDLLKRK